jgi:hypothetical protein
MQGIFVQLYRKADGEWVGQFRDAVAAIQYLASIEANENDYELKFQASKYPSA